jgi:hypothetical protein
VGREELEAQLRNAHGTGFTSHAVRFEPIEGVPNRMGETASAKVKAAGAQFSGGLL